MKSILKIGLITLVSLTLIGCTSTKPLPQKQEKADSEVLKTDDSNVTLNTEDTNTSKKGMTPVEIALVPVAIAIHLPMLIAATTYATAVGVKEVVKIAAKAATGGYSDNNTTLNDLNDTKVSE